MERINYVLLGFAISALVIASFSVYVNGAITTTTVDNAGRREYAYCPIQPENMLSTAKWEVDGCPLIRVYITNWNTLSVTDKSTIDTQLRGAGFRDVGELDARTK